MIKEDVPSNTIDQNIKKALKELSPSRLPKTILTNL